MNFKCTEDYILENEVVQLRPLKEEDFKFLSEYSLNEPELWKYSITGADGEENLRNYLRTAGKGRQDEKEYAFIVYHKQDKKYIGSTRFYDIQPKNQMLQLGFTWYGKKYQGTGINKHCKYLLLKFVFEDLNIQRVEFRANAKNERSIYAMKSIGCKVEGILRSNAVALNGERRDSIVLSILQDEWYSEVKENLRKKLVM
jgi:RimJ/RimL family protein N-acetyltransferase